MVTNFFLIGNHFEEFRSQVAIRKKKLIIRLVLVTLKKGYYVNQWLVHISAMRSLRYETLAEKFEEHSRDCNCSQLHLKQFLLHLSCCQTFAHTLYFISPWMQTNAWINYEFLLTWDNPSSHHCPTYSHLEYACRELHSQSAFGWNCWQGVCFWLF